MPIEFSPNMRRIEESGTLAIFARVKQMQRTGQEVLSLVVGELDCETPDFIKQAGIRAIREGFTRYTVNSGIPELREAIARKLREDNDLEYAPDEILVSAGSKQAFYNILYALCGEGDEVIIFTPNYTSHPDQVRLVGATPVLVPSRVENNYQIEAEALRRAITGRTRMIILNSPNNPSSQLYTKDSFEVVAKAAMEHDLWILSDELYEKIVFPPHVHYSIAQLFPEVKERSLVANGLSKTYAMTGWRLGYGAGPRDVIKAAALVQSHTTNNASSISQKAALAALTEDDGSFFRELIPELEKKRDTAHRIISSIDGLDCPNAQGAFYLFPSVRKYIGKRYGDRVMNGSLDLAMYLLEEKHVAIVPGVAFNMEGAIRISFATDLETIEKGCLRIKEGLEQLV
jgi:aspartate aminotransferase